jgi:hypothetical protein
LDFHEPTYQPLSISFYRIFCFKTEFVLKEINSGQDNFPEGEEGTSAVGSTADKPGKASEMLGFSAAGLQFVHGRRSNVVFKLNPGCRNFNAPHFVWFKY